MPDRWLSPDPIPEILPGHAHVFRLRLDLDQQRLAALSALLNEDERARAARYIPEASRRQFTAARAQMRQVLGALLRREPAELRFNFGAYGKPSLADGDLCFNLSHSAGLALLGVSRTQEIGVDIKSTHRVVEYDQLAPRFFAATEAAALAALPASERGRAFFSIWTRKEAYIKACGMGLSLPLQDFSVSHDHPATLSAEGWSIRALDPGPGYAAALVIAGDLHALHTWDW